MEGDRFFASLFKIWCQSAGHRVDWKEEPILDSRGHLIKEHRLMKELDFQLPDWTTVVVMELEPPEAPEPGEVSPEVFRRSDHGAVLTS